MSTASQGKLTQSQRALASGSLHSPGSPSHRDSRELYARCASCTQAILQDTGVGHPLFSRRLFNRAWWIAGASDDNDDLRLKIRDRLIKGALFPPPARIWAG